MHGWYAEGLSADVYKTCRNFDFADLPHSMQISYLGDGMSVNCVSNWFLYIVTHIVRKESVQAFMPGLLKSIAKPPEMAEPVEPKSVITVEEDSQEPCFVWFAVHRAGAERPRPSLLHKAMPFMFIYCSTRHTDVRSQGFAPLVVLQEWFDAYAPSFPKSGRRSYGRGCEPYGGCPW